MKYIQPIIIIILFLFLIQNNCSDKPKPFTETKLYNDSSKIYFDRYIIEKIKAEKLDFKSKQLSIEYQKKLNYWKNRVIISKKVELIEDIIDCNDTVQKMIRIAHINDSLCVDLVDRHEKSIIFKDSLLFVYELQNKFILKSLDNKNLENSALKNNFDTANQLLKSEKRNKWIWKVTAIGALGLSVYKTL